MSIEIGSRLRALVDFETTALVHWNAPMTSGAHCTVKRGTIFRVYSSPNSLTGSFHATLEDKELEARFAGKDSVSSKYAGLSFVFDASEIGRRFERL